MNTPCSGSSALVATTGVVDASKVAHKLTASELYSLGWMFHVTDARFERSVYSKGLVRKNRDSLHFMYENDGSDATFQREQGPDSQGGLTPQSDCPEMVLF